MPRPGWRTAAALLALPAAAAAQEAETAIPPEHRAEAERAQDMVDRLEAGDKTAPALAAARALREDCLASGNHRSAEFLAGHIVAAFPAQLRDHHRFVEILLARGKTDRAVGDLRELLKERPSDCEAYGMLSDLLLEKSRPAEAMEVHGAHLREHAHEAGPLNARATIALWELRDAAGARAAAKEMRVAADRPGARDDVARWLRTNADGIDADAARKEKDRAVLGAASRRLDRVLWATVIGLALALGAAGWFTRQRT